MNRFPTIGNFGGPGGRGKTNFTRRVYTINNNTTASKKGTTSLGRLVMLVGEIAKIEERELYSVTACSVA